MGLAKASGNLQLGDRATEGSFPTRARFPVAKPLLFGIRSVSRAQPLLGWMAHPPRRNRFGADFGRPASVPSDRPLSSSWLQAQDSINNPRIAILILGLFI